MHRVTKSSPKSKCENMSVTIIGNTKYRPCDVTFVLRKEAAQLRQRQFDKHEAHTKCEFTEGH